jgi:hypothetical protein
MRMTADIEVEIGLVESVDRYQDDVLGVTLIVIRDSCRGCKRRADRNGERKSAPYSA